MIVERECRCTVVESRSNCTSSCSVVTRCTVVLSGIFSKGDGCLGTLLLFNFVIMSHDSDGGPLVVDRTVVAWKCCRTPRNLRVLSNHVHQASWKNTKKHERNDL